MPKKQPATIPEPVASEITVDDIDNCNEKIRRARMLTVLALTTLESDKVLVTREFASDADSDCLSNAVCESLEQVKDTLRELHDYINGRWNEIRLANGGVR